jgi:hypothetical protein
MSLSRESSLHGLSLDTTHTFPPTAFIPLPIERPDHYVPVLCDRKLDPLLSPGNLLVHPPPEEVDPVYEQVVII